MDVKVLRECGYEESALGFSLSYNSTPERAKDLFGKFAFKQGGENKFLESITIWLDVNAPRFWWQEADTYRVGSTKQSESTMHTLSKGFVSETDFEYPVGEQVIIAVNNSIICYNNRQMSIAELKNILPEGFLQRRVWCINYKTLQNMFFQRANHRLPQWQIFFRSIFSQLEHPELIAEELSKGTL